ncbi:hypothetical protein BDZ45DRAFT_682215 [Acephala macrosclerotiorum]|nr:hypothetical protein BDZ45DRAFT_682215 [Acephala macrosclerotiorum]
MSSNSDSRGPAVVITSIFFTVFSLLFVFMRLVARLGFLKNPGRDEIAIVISSLSSIALLVATLLQVKYGLGKHFENLTPDEFEKVLKCLWVAIICYNISLSATKISIILQYMRVFVGRRIQLVCWIVLGIVIAYFIQAILTAIWTCVPISAFWNLSEEGNCINKKFLWFFNAAFNILTDLIIITLPMPALSTLRLPLRQKIGLMGVFALGGFVCLVSVLRLHALYIVSISTDITYDNVDAAIWSIIEVNVGIICASLPTIKPLISCLFPGLLGSTRSRQGTYHNQANRHASPFASQDPFTSLSNAPGRLADQEGGHKTITRVEAGERSEPELAKSIAHGEDGKDIFVMTSMTQDVETKLSRNGSETGSEKDLIFQYN